MLMDYETEEGIAGNMLCYTYYPAFHASMRRPEDQFFVEPQPVTLPVDRDGWHEIRLGMHCVSNARLEDRSYSFTDG